MLSWGCRDSWSWRGRATFVVLLITSALSLWVPGRSPLPPRSCPSPGGPSRASTSRRPLVWSSRDDWIRVQAPGIFAPLQSYACSPRSEFDLPLMGFVRVDPRAGHLCPIRVSPTSSPLHRHALWRPLPVGCLHPAFGPWHTMPEVSFRPCGFAPLRRFAPPIVPENAHPCGCLRVAGLLHPAANRGVRRVSGLSVLLPGRTSLPRDATYPSKDSTRPQPYRVTTALAFLTFTHRAVRASRICVAASSLLRASRCELAFKALLCG
jgi:hypothetical protein